MTFHNNPEPFLSCKYNLEIYAAHKHSLILLLLTIYFFSSESTNQFLGSRFRGSVRAQYDVFMNRVGKKTLETVHRQKLTVTEALVFKGLSLTNNA